MRESNLVRIGKWLMKHNRLSICIVDDEGIYFNSEMLKIAAAAGFGGIERYPCVTADLLTDLLTNPRDIVILDIQGVTEPSVAKDGFEVAGRLFKSTRSYVAVTSAHTHRLQKAYKEFDYVIEERLLTGVDFVDELEFMISDYLGRKTWFYKKLLFRTGFGLARGALLPG